MKKMILKELKIETWKGDPTNCYIVQDEESKETMVIDPAGDVEKIIEMLDILQAKLKYIIHQDIHLEDLAYIVKKKDFYFQEIHYLEELGEEQIHLQEILMKS